MLTSQSEARYRYIIQEYLLEKAAVTDLEKYPFQDAPHSDIYEGKLDNEAVALKRWRVSKVSDEQTEKTLRVGSTTYGEIRMLI